jgi:hypothetical protein
MPGSTSSPAGTGLYCPFGPRGSGCRHREPSLEWPTKASPRTPAGRGSVGRSAQRRLGVSQRECACVRPPAETAPEPPRGPTHRWVPRRAAPSATVHKRPRLKPLAPVYDSTGSERLLCWRGNQQRFFGRQPKAPSSDPSVRSAAPTSSSEAARRELKRATAHGDHVRASPLSMGGIPALCSPQHLP